uniref:Uncharacterized protein n=1 Tax=Panagrolaimus superbus TaxID=310955 RepID=A0A914YMS2_9BILA
MSRGLYTCTSSYLDSLGKLHALIAEVYADYQNCQNLIKTTPKTFSRTDIDALDDMLDEWEKEDQAVAAAIPSQKSSTTSQKSEPQQQQQQQELTEERREDAASEVVVVTAPDSTYPPSQM